MARLDDCQMEWVLNCPRDARGRLVEDEGLPSWIKVDERGQRVVENPVGFKTMFETVKGWQGDESPAAAWHEYVEANPRLRLIYGEE